MERLLKAKIEPGRAAIHWLGQGGFAFKAHACPLIVVDPYLSDSANRDGNAPRLAPIPIKPRNLSLDILFLTHDHIDHTDPATVTHLMAANPDARVVCPPASARHLEKLGVAVDSGHVVTPGDRLKFGNLIVDAVPAQHTDDSVGFVFQFLGGTADPAGPTIYITGDTLYTPMLAESVAELDPDLLIVPINGRWGNMTAEEAAKLAVEIAPQEVIPMHYGMFAANTADPAEFLSALTAATPEGMVIRPVVMKHDTCHVCCPRAVPQGKHEVKRERSEKAVRAHRSHEHHDGVRGPRTAVARTNNGRH
jgi:L-ascorbate metabolism protein UlaG (beta-lactamase superfamily)